MNKDELKKGMKLAYLGVQYKIATIKAELSRKGIEEDGIEVLESFIEDCINDLE